MKKTSNKRSLEGYKIFPYIAWLLIIGFAVFAYNLTNEVGEVTHKLQQETVYTNEPDFDFEAYQNKL